MKAFYTTLIRNNNNMINILYISNGAWQRCSTLWEKKLYVCLNTTPLVNW